MKKALFTWIFALLASASAWTQTFITVDNLTYMQIDPTANTVLLTYYETAPTGALDIPATVTHNGRTYTVTSIGEQAFAGCNALTQVTIPRSVIHIETRAFDQCPALTHIYVESENTAFSSEDGILFNKDKTILLCYPAGKPDTAYTPPASVREIGNSAFEGCNRLAQVTLPNTVKSTGTRVFYGCSALTQVNICNGITRIEGHSFHNCTALTQVNLPESLTFIGSNAFTSCTALTQLTLPNAVNNIGSYAFAHCTALTEMTLPESLTKVQFNCFEGCSALTKVNIPQNVTNIESDCFKNCTALTEMTIRAIVPPAIKTDAFRGCPRIFVYVFAEAIAAYENSYEHTDIWFHFDLQTILCTVYGLKYEITDTKAKTARLAGYETEPAGKLDMADTISIEGTTYTLTIIGKTALAFCPDLTEVSIPASVTSIENAAFYKCISLRQVDIPHSVTHIEEQLFTYCYALTHIHVDNGNTAFCSVDGILFNKGQTTLVRYPAGKAETAYTLPESVTRIDMEAFGHVAALTQVCIGSRVTHIGRFAFSGCTALRQLTVLAPVPPMLEKGVFNKVNRGIPVYVPATALEAYRAAEGWKEFTNLQAISDTSA